MTRRFFKYLAVGLLAVIPLGCEPQPVVVNPDDDDAAIIEEDVEVETNGVTSPPADSGTNVDIGVGGGRGVDVDVDRDAEPNTNP